MTKNLTNTGNSSINLDSSMYDLENSVESITINDIIKNNNIDKIKLLKIDCEGSEYEILNNADKNILNKVEYLFGEFHAKCGKYNPNELLDSMKSIIKNVNVTIHYN